MLPLLARTISRFLDRMKRRTLSRTKLAVGFSDLAYSWVAVGEILWTSEKRGNDEDDGPMMRPLLSMIADRPIRKL